MSKRLFTELKKIFFIILAGIIYYFIYCILGCAIPCIFNKITGLLCPACGVTRMIYAISKGNFTEAYGYNKGLFITMPIILTIFTLDEIHYIKSGHRQMSRFFKLILVAEIVFLLIFGILRNII